MEKTSILLIYLGILALWDHRQGLLPLRILAAGTVLFLGEALYMLAGGQRDLLEIVFAAVPGGLLLCLWGATEKVGPGDGVVLLQLALCLPTPALILAFGISMSAMGIFSGALLLLRRVKGNSRLPYIPFLWLGSLAAVLICK